MKKIVINGLQYKKRSSGIGVMIRELFAPLTQITERTCQIILPQDSPGIPVQGTKYAADLFSDISDGKAVL